MTDWRDKLKAARLPEKTVRVVLRGDLAVEYDRVTKELEQARAAGATSLAGSGVGALEEELHRIEQEAQGGILEVRLRGLPRTRRPGDSRPSWAELKAQHPPRYKDDEMLIGDRLAGGLDRDSIAEPLVRLSIVEPGDITDADWADLMAALTDAQFDELVAAAWELSQGRVDIPFSSGGSATTQSSAAA